MQRRDDEGVEAAAIAALVPLDGKRVLEVGCGKGRLTALAAARASSVYSFDPSAENVAAARTTLTSEPSIARTAKSLVTRSPLRLD